MHKNVCKTLQSPPRRGARNLGGGSFSADISAWPVEGPCSASAAHGRAADLRRRGRAGHRRRCCSSTSRRRASASRSCVRGDGALDAIRRQPPDLIVLDLMLPGLDGLELTRLLKRDPATARVPLVMLDRQGRGGRPHRRPRAGRRRLHPEAVQPARSRAPDQGGPAPSLRRGRRRRRSRPAASGSTPRRTGSRRGARRSP